MSSAPTPNSHSHPTAASASPARGFASLPPIVKLAAWVGATAAIAAVVQLAAWLVGIDLNVLSHSGRGVLLAAALATLMAIMAADGRPVSEYGLFVGKQWTRFWFGGMGAGLATFGVATLIAVACGAIAIQTERFGVDRGASATLSALTAFPVALVQQVIFTGYLLSMLRDRYARGIAVVVSSLCFALLYHLGEPSRILAYDGFSLVVGMFLMASLLSLLRLKSGTILLPAGVLAGWIFARRLFRKSTLFAAVDASPWSAWLAPEGDIRQAPVTWVALGAAIGWTAWSLRRHGEGKVSTVEPAMDASFKRVFPLSNGSMLAPLDLWLGRLIDARCRVGVKYLPRLVAVLAFSTVNTILSLPERIVLPLVLRRRALQPPVFILGTHRSGTTHLHNLLSKDPRYCTPLAYQIMNPVGFLFSGWLITPLMGAFMPWKRPMDSVRFHVFSPQEEEFAISGTSSRSPYWALTFPRRIAHYDRFIFVDQMSPAEQTAWRKTYELFLKKVTFWKPHKRLLLKNPHNTGRMAALREMFPGAKFIHIHRHPYAVYRSNMHMAREGHVVNQLQDPDPNDSYSTRFLTNYRAMESRFVADCGGASDREVAEVAFESLEHDPVCEIQRIYAELDIEFTSEFGERLERYVESVAGYKKNRLPELDAEVRAAIDGEMAPLLTRWGYAGAERDTATQRAA